MIHAGVYYQPGSLKADFCKRGAEQTVTFCEQHGIEVENCGKLLVATSLDEMARMENLYERCLDNEIEVELLTQEQLKEREPNVTGLGAIYVKSTSIVDYRKVTLKMVEEFVSHGGQISLRTRVTAMEEHAEEVQLTCVSDGQTMQLNCDFVITCCGLMADRMTKMLKIPTDFQIVPYRGEYYRLDERFHDYVSHLIYPIPDPELPFLGVHLTRMVDGSITVGPNAVQGWKREGYSRVNFSIKDSLQMLSFSGFWRVTSKHLMTGIQELRDSWWKKGYLKRVQKYCPDISSTDLKAYPAGIRAQAVMRDGTLVHDFLFSESARTLHVCNAPSPAATSAIPIGEYICNKVAKLKVSSL